MRIITKLPQWRIWCGVLLVILAGIGCFVCVSQLLINLVPPHRISILRIATICLICVGVLVVAALTLRDMSILWQVALQSIAAGGIVAGTGLIVTSMIYNRRALLGYAGVVGVTSLALGLSAAALMRNRQRRRHRKA